MHQKLRLVEIKLRKLMVSYIAKRDHITNNLLNREETTKRLAEVNLHCSKFNLNILLCSLLARSHVPALTEEVVVDLMKYTSYSFRFGFYTYQHYINIYNCIVTCFTIYVVNFMYYVFYNLSYFKYKINALLWKVISYVGISGFQIIWD